MRFKTGRGAKVSREQGAAAREPERDAEATPGPPPVRLNFVMAPSYHSSTLLAQLLNNHPEISCLGDTLPHRRVHQNQACGCGQKVKDCPFWQEVNRRLDTDRFAHCDHMIPAYPQVVRSSGVNSYVARGLTAAALALGPGVWKLAGTSSREFLETFLLYGEVVCEMHGTRVFVNNQKSLTSLLAFRSLLQSRAEIRIIHLIRDPRGFFLSERKQDALVSPRASAQRWLLYHRRVARLQRYAVPGGYLRLLYEDLCSDGDTAMAKVCALLGVEARPLCLPTVYPEKDHVLGNVTRFAFDGQIRPSLKWMEAVSAADQQEILRVTKPLSEELGYV